MRSPLDRLAGTTDQLRRADQARITVELRGTETPDEAGLSALRAVAAELSTSVDMHAQDPQGRPAILLTLDSEHQTHQWWFDPQSHQPLDIEGFVVQAAGVVSDATSTDLNRSFVPQLHP